MGRTQFRGLGFLVVALTVVLFLGACVGQQQPQAGPTQKPLRIALFTPVRANAYDQAYIDGANSKSQEYNAQIDVFSCEFNTQEQINQIQDAITAGKYEAFAIHPNDSNAIVPAIQEALKKGIIVIAMESPIGPDTRSLKPYPPGLKCVVGCTGWSIGTWLGKAVVKASEGKDPCKVAYLIGAQSLTIDQDRYEGLKEVIKDHRNIKIVAFQEGQYRRDVSREIMQNVFQAQSDIDVVVSSGDQMTLGAYDAAKEAGLEKKIKFIGNGCSKEGWQAIKDGELFASYANIPYTEGQLVVEIAAKALRGEAVPEFINLEDRRPPLPAEGPIITRDNLDQFQPQW